MMVNEPELLVLFLELELFQFLVKVVLGHDHVCCFTTFGEPILNRISKKFTIRVRFFLSDANLKTKLIAR